MISVDCVAACRLNRYAVSNCSLVNVSFILEPSTDIGNCMQYLLDCIDARNQSAFPETNTSG